MYGHGSVLGCATGAATAATCAVLPQTGMNSAVQIALAVAAGLAVWAGIYVAQAKFGKR